MTEGAAEAVGWDRGRSPDLIQGPGPSAELALCPLASDLPAQHAS